MVCKNCEANFEGKFCSNCGQTADVHRITLRHFFHELFHAVTHADKGFLLLARTLLIRPGHVAREYLEGKRKKYFNPLTFLVLTAAISAFAIYQTGYFKAMATGRGPGQSGQSAELRERPSESMIAFFKTLNEATRISIEHQKLLDLLLIFPLMSFFTWLLFGRKKANFAENLVLNAFTMGEYNIITVVVFVPAFLLAPDTAQMNNNILHVVILIYMIVAYHQFFKNHWALTILKSLAVMILYIIFFWLAIMAFVVIKNSVQGQS
jgi:hypothetical protein